MKNDNGPDVFTSYYDIDTFQQNKRTKNKGCEIINMIPFMLFCQMICNLFTKREEENTCFHCEPRTRTFKLEGRESSVGKFVDFLMNISKNRSKSKVFLTTHNGRSLTISISMPLY